jgi:hypothetical protein
MKIDLEVEAEMLGRMSLFNQKERQQEHKLDLREMKFIGW